MTLPGPPPPLPTVTPAEPVEEETRAPRPDESAIPPVPPLPPLVAPVETDAPAEPEAPAEGEEAAMTDETVDAEEPSTTDEAVATEEAVAAEHPVAIEVPVENDESAEPETDGQLDVVESSERAETVEADADSRAEASELPVEEASVDALVVPTDDVDDFLPEEPGSESVTVVSPDVTADADADTPAPALALRGVVKQFGEMRAVDAIDLMIPAGSFFGLVGPNGAGKTTTLSMIAGLLRPDSGTIEVCGVDTATDASRAKKLIGVLPDRLRTFDRLTGRQLLYYYGVLRGLSSSVVQSRIADLARAFDLVDALGRVVSDYSAGMTKKVMLAGAMIHSPRVLVLDEPFESLDPASSQVILDILETYVAHGGTVVLSSHGMALVERVCTRVAVLVEGEVLAAGTVDEVRGELTLEQRFVELSGGVDDAEGLEWLHTFSD